MPAVSWWKRKTEDVGRTLAQFREPYLLLHRGPGTVVHVSGSSAPSPPLGCLPWDVPFAAAETARAPAAHREEAMGWFCVAGVGKEWAQGTSPLFAGRAIEVLGCGVRLNLLLLALQKTTT